MADGEIPRDAEEDPDGGSRIAECRFKTAHC